MGVEDGSEILNMPMPQRQARARELLRSAATTTGGLVLHATDVPVMNQAAQVIAQNLRQIGMNVVLASSDWGGVVTRRASRTRRGQRQHHDRRLERVLHLERRQLDREPDRPVRARAIGQNACSAGRRTRSPSSCAPSGRGARSRDAGRGGAAAQPQHVRLRARHQDGQWFGRRPIAATACAASSSAGGRPAW